MTTTPFLGCKISLISKSEIRYEGILYTIDPKESTIALAKVKSFGTEDRPAERKVAPREEVFEYIIFRASDIKDLIVDDPPASIAPGLADPAIIQAHSTSTTTSGSSTFPSGTIPNIQSTASQHQAQQSQGLTSFQSAFGAPPTHVSGVPVSYNTSGSIGSRSGNSTPTGNRGKSPHHDHTTGTSGVNITIGGRQTPKDNQQYRQQNRNQNQQNQRRLGGQTQRRQGGMMQQNYNRQPHNYSAQTRGSRPGNRYGSMTGGSGGGGNNVWGLYRRDPLRSRQPQQQRSNSRNRNRSKQRNKSQSENTLKIEGDYDFEKAHEEFVKMVKGMSNVKISDDGNSSNPNPQEEVSEDKVVDSSNTDANTNDDSSQAKGDENKLEPCYDKTKSFFDKISCESLQKEKGEVQKVNWKQERQLNTETFGMSQSKNGWRRPNSYRGRGYGYGSGGGRPGGHYRQNRGGRTGQGAENRRFIQRNRN